MSQSLGVGSGPCGVRNPAASIATLASALHVVGARSASQCCSQMGVSVRVMAAMACAAQAR